MSAVYPLAELVVLLGGVVVFLQSRRRLRPAGRPLSLPYRDEPPAASFVRRTLQEAWRRCPGRRSDRVP